jgi:RluA family pseudouridine synthase
MFLTFVTDFSAPLRLLDYCRLNLSTVFLSKNAVLKAIKRAELLLNDLPTSSGVYVNLGDKISYNVRDASHYKPFELKFDIVFEDDFLAIINKPAGYDVSGNKYQTIQNALSFNLRPSGQADALPRPRPVHRLDNQTSGLLVVAKTYASVIYLSKQFEDRLVSKHYQAVCLNTFPSNLKVNQEIDGLIAQTHFELIEAFEHRFLGALSLVSAKPITGRKHQIRKHLQQSGFSILGDKLYGEHYNKGLFLFAQSIRFRHPISEELLVFELKLPNKFSTVLRHKRET